MTEAQGGLTINTDGGNDVVNVAGVNGDVLDKGSLTINATTGATSVYISPTAQRAGLLIGTLTINGDSKTDLEVDDQSDPVGMTWVLATKKVVQDGSSVTYGTMRRSAWPFEEIDFTGVGTAQLHGGTNDTSYVVQDTEPGGTTIVNTGAGVNTVDVQGTTGPLGVVDNGTSSNNVVDIGNSTDGVQDIKGGVVVYNEAEGQDALNIDNSAITGDYSVTLGLNAITGLAPAEIDYFAGIDHLSITTGKTVGGDVINVQATSAPTELITEGLQQVTVGDQGTLQNINGNLLIAGDSELIVDDSQDSGNHTATPVTLSTLFQSNPSGGGVVDEGVIAGLSTGQIAYGYALTQFVGITTGSGTDAVDVQGTGVRTTLLNNGGQETVDVGKGGLLSGIRGILTVENVSNSSPKSRGPINLVLDDSADRVGETAAISGYGGLDPLAGFDAITGFAPAAINDLAGSLGSLTLKGGSGTNTLVGPNATNAWQITGTNAGTIDGFNFSNFANLTGGTGVDAFVFGAGASVTGTINGGGGGDWLDYAADTNPVTVNLATGTATGVGGGISNIQDVRGGQGGNTLTGNSQGNILIGGAGADTITGGSGRSIFIGDQGADTITAGSGDSILIGCTTDYDSSSLAHDLALESILGEWQSTDVYSTRINRIKNGGGPNGSNTLVFGVTVHDDGRANTLIGGAGDDWFFEGANDQIRNSRPGEQVN